QPMEVTTTMSLDGMTLDEIERQRILQALKQYDNNLSQVAVSLGLSRPALYRRLEKHNIVI
ncbi:MAG: sigma-54-dependent Fis family transcriptional regulator, partial [Bacteroidales bacterium]|nr:sigma-54-dependent Fis family transcriptional regulator [Bacteroidales bacterium]